MRKATITAPAFLIAILSVCANLTAQSTQESIAPAAVQRDAAAAAVPAAPTQTPSENQGANVMPPTAEQLEAYLVPASAAPAAATKTPTENQGANAMAVKILYESNGLLRLVKFTKTNGQKSNANGIEMYTMDCEVEAIALQDCATTGFGVGGSWDGQFGAMPAQKNTSGMDQFNPFGGAYAGYRQLPKDKKMTFTTKVSFELTERGWRTEGRLPADKPFVADIKTISDSNALFEEAKELGKKGRAATNPQEREKYYQQAFKLFQKGADAGNSYAMFALGACYHDGAGVAKDLVESAKWTQKAVDAGNDMAIALIREGSEKNLKGIYLQCALYMTEHGDQLPPHMAHLVINGSAGFGLFVRPGSSTSPMTTPGNLAGVCSTPWGQDLKDLKAYLDAHRADFDAFDAHCDYVYLGAELTAADDPSVILIYEKPWTREGLNVVFNDGHVEWITREKVPEVLQRDASLRKAAARSISLPK